MVQLARQKRIALILLPFRLALNRLCLPAAEITLVWKEETTRPPGDLTYDFRASGQGVRPQTPEPAATPISLLTEENMVSGPIFQ
jgi:hypothetical protein